MRLNIRAFPHTLGNPSSYMTLHMLSSEFPYTYIRKIFPNFFNIVANDEFSLTNTCMFWQILCYFTKCLLFHYQKEKKLYHINLKWIRQKHADPDNLIRPQSLLHKHDHNIVHHSPFKSYREERRWAAQCRSTPSPPRRDAWTCRGWGQERCWSGCCPTSPPPAPHPERGTVSTSVVAEMETYWNHTVYIPNRDVPVAK